MNTHKKYIPILGTLLILGMIPIFPADIGPRGNPAALMKTILTSTGLNSSFELGAAAALMGNDPESPVLNLACMSEVPADQNKELEQFFKVKNAVFSRDWADVRSGMERYLRDYPGGTMKDEALYWLAYGLNQLSRDAKDKAAIIDLKTRAGEALDRLMAARPTSLWVDDAKQLKISIAGQLALLGVPGQEKIVEDAARTANKNHADLQIEALNSLIKLNPQAAIQAGQDLLKKTDSSALRKNVVSLLGRRFTLEVRALLEDVVRRDADENVSREAAYWLEKIRSRLLPVKLNYYCFEAQIKDPALSAQLAEGQVTATALSGKGMSKAMSEIKRIYGKKIELSGSMSISLGGDDYYDYLPNDRIEGRSSSYVSHRIAGINLALDGPSIRKTSTSIGGRFSFDETAAPFRLEKDRAVLLAARRGDKLALVYLEVEAKEKSSFRASERAGSISIIKNTADSAPTRKIEEPDPTVYSTATHYKNGDLIIHSNAMSWDPVTSKPGAVVDFGKAKAEIRTPGGTWTLTGYILYKDKEDLLVGRSAKLIRPDGFAAAAGAEIRVPVKNPAGFQTSEKTGPLAPAEKKPAVSTPGGIHYALSINLDNGGWIHSVRTSYDPQEITRDMVDFQTAKAELPAAGGTWILTGHLVFFPKDKRILARGGVLTDPAGKIAAQGAFLMVPTARPDQFTIDK